MRKNLQKEVTSLPEGKRLNRSLTKIQALSNVLLGDNKVVIGCRVILRVARMKRSKKHKLISAGGRESGAKKLEPFLK